MTLTIPHSTCKMVQTCGQATFRQLEFRPVKVQSSSIQSEWKKTMKRKLLFLLTCLISCETKPQNVNPCIGNNCF